MSGRDEVSERKWKRLWRIGRSRDADQLLLSSSLFKNDKFILEFVTYTQIIDKIEEE